MVMDWNQYHKEIGGRVGELGKLSPDTLRGYQTFERRQLEDDKLGEKTRQFNFPCCRRHHPLRRLHCVPH